MTHLDVCQYFCNRVPWLVHRYAMTYSYNADHFGICDTWVMLQIRMSMSFYEWVTSHIRMTHDYRIILTSRYTSYTSYWYLDIRHIRHIDISIYVIYVILISRYTSYTSYWYLDIRTSHIWMTHDYRIILISRYKSYTSYWYLDIRHIRHIDISIYVIYVILISRYTSYTSYWYLDIRTSHIWMTHDYRIILISRYTSYTSYWYLGHESLISRYEYDVSRYQYDVSRYQYDVLISRYTSYWYLDIRTNKSCHAYT